MTATVKVFIDIFIGVWAFVLAWIWTTISILAPRREGASDRNLAAVPEVHPRLRRDLRDRAGAGARAPAGASDKLAAAIGEANVLRVIFFTLTFFSIGVMSNFRKLWEDGLGNWQPFISSACSAS